MGIRVPDAQYQAPTPEPEQAQVPMPKQPVANANMFGASQAAAGVEAGAKVSAASADIADKIIQEKSWSQTSQVFENRELLNEHADKLMNDTDTFDFKKADGTIVQIPKGYALRPSWAAVSPDDFKVQMQAYNNSLSPDGKGGGWLNSVNKMNQRYTDEPISSNYGKLDTYNRDQVMKETAATNALALEKATGNSVDQPTMSKAIHYVSTVSMYQQAHGQISPKDQVANNQKLYSNVMNMYAENNIGKVSAEDLKKQVDDSMAASGGLITPAMKTDIYNKIDKLNDAYQTKIQINHENDQKAAVQQYSNDIASEKINPTNATVILTDKNLPMDVKTAYYNAVMNVETQRAKTASNGFFGIGKKPEDATIPVTKENLGIDFSGDDEKTKDANDTATAVIKMANSLSHEEATANLVSAIKDKGEKLSKEDLNIYSRTLALIGQALPTQTEAAQGKTIDPKSVPAIAAAKQVATTTKNLGLKDNSASTQFHDNHDKGMAVEDNLKDVNKTIANKISPSTVETGTPNMIIPTDGKKASVIHFSLSTNIAPHIIFKPKVEKQPTSPAKKTNE